MVVDQPRGVSEAARLSKWWLVSAALHLGGGAGVYLSLADPAPPPEVEEVVDTVQFLPPPTDARALETPLDDDRIEATERKRADRPTVPERVKQPERVTHGLAGRAGPRHSRQVKATEGAAPVRAKRVVRRRPVRVPPVAKTPPEEKRKPKPQKAPDIEYGKAKDAARRTMDQFVGHLTPEEAIPEEQAFAMIIERTAEGPIRGDLPRVGRRGKLRRRATTERPSGDEGLGAMGAPDITRMDKTLRMDTDLMRRHPYWKAVYDKVQPHWRFPRWAEDQKLQGEVHISFRFDSETGGVSNFEVVRRSRVKGFDENVIEAVRRAAPFGRVPVDAPSATQIVWPFKFRNPLF